MNKAINSIAKKQSAPPNAKHVRSQVTAESDYWASKYQNNPAAT
jgi:hypothetical protein